MIRFTDSFNQLDREKFPADTINTFVRNFHGRFVDAECVTSYNYWQNSPCVGIVEIPVADHDLVHVMELVEEIHDIHALELDYMILDKNRVVIRFLFDNIGV